MAKKKEFPTEEWVFVSNSKVLYKQRPTTELQSLMELAPFQEARIPSLESTAHLKELTGQAIDDLSPEDRWIFNALIVERLSLRGAGRILGLSLIHI